MAPNGSSLFKILAEQMVLSILPLHAQYLQIKTFMWFCTERLKSALIANNSVQYTLDKGKFQLLSFSYFWIAFMPENSTLGCF